MISLHGLGRIQGCFRSYRLTTLLWLITMIASATTVLALIQKGSVVVEPGLESFGPPKDEAICLEGNLGHTADECWEKPKAHKYACFLRCMWARRRIVIPCTSSMSHSSCFLGRYATALATTSEGGLHMDGRRVALPPTRWSAGAYSGHDHDGAMAYLASP